MDQRQPEEMESYGVLVGWSHHGFNGRVDLCLQRVRTVDGLDRDEVEQHHFVMTDSQALILANYLGQVMADRGMSPPQRRRRGLLGRLFGS